jgi:hypothetical protein
MVGRWTVHDDMACRREKRNEGKERFSSTAKPRLDAHAALLFLLPGIDYMPGLIGLNNMRQNDYANVIVQALMRILPIRYAYGQALYLG